MRFHLIGGVSCGEVIDLTDPEDWWVPPVINGVIAHPRMIGCHSDPSNRTVYKLVDVAGTNGWYQVDPTWTAWAQRATEDEWRAFLAEVVE